MLSRHLNNFEIQKYDQNKPTFNYILSRNILPKIKDGAINLIAFGLNISPKKQKIQTQQKYYTKYLENTSLPVRNVWIPFYWIY